MLPCRIRSSLWIGRAMSKHLLPKPSFRLYSTNQDSDTPSEDQTEAPKEKHFWEVESSKPHHKPTARVTRAAKENESFRNLLDSLLTSQTKPEKESPKNDSYTSNANPVIAKQLLQMAINNTQPYKEKKPLPRSAISTMYGKTAERIMQPETPEDDPILDFLYPREEDSFGWDQTKVSQDERIVAKQEEMETTRAIVESETLEDLWQCVSKQINRQEYPAYYPRVLTKAIECAAPKNPYLALSIFEHAKQASMLSYIMGCTTQVYNAMLLLRWEAWGDINGMLDLVEEMTVNGIDYNNDSRRIIRTVVQEIESEGGYSKDDIQQVSDGVYWSAEERRSCNLMKELAGKWIISK